MEADIKVPEDHRRVSCFPRLFSFLGRAFLLHLSLVTRHWPLATVLYDLLFSLFPIPYSLFPAFGCVNNTVHVYQIKNRRV